jgi:hypothetical protein
MVWPASPSRWSAQARVGALSRVDGVSRSQRAQPLDPARATDPRPLDLLAPRDADWPRPDPARIAAADIARFEALLQGAVGRRAAASNDLSTAPAATERAGLPLAGAPPADRIAYTLRQLHRVPGL